MEGGRGTPRMCEGFFFLRSPSKIFILALHDTEYNNKQYLLYLQKYMLTILPVLITTLLTILTIATTYNTNICNVNNTDKQDTK